MDLFSNELESLQAQVRDLERAEAEQQSNTTQKEGIIGKSIQGEEDTEVEGNKRKRFKSILQPQQKQINNVSIYQSPAIMSSAIPNINNRNNNAATSSSSIVNPIQSVQMVDYLNIQAMQQQQVQYQQIQEQQQTQQTDQTLKSKKRKKHLRSAAGEVWEDPTLEEWPQNDFRLFCGNLGNDVNDEILSNAFSIYPSFMKAKVVRDKRTTKSKGYGFASFLDPLDFQKAFKEKNGRYVGNRPIKLRRSSWKDRNLTKKSKSKGGGMKKKKQK